GEFAGGGDHNLSLLRPGHEPETPRILRRIDGLLLLSRFLLRSAQRTLSRLRLRHRLDERRHRMRIAERALVASRRTLRLCWDGRERYANTGQAQDDEETGRGSPERAQALHVAVVLLQRHRSPITAATLCSTPCGEIPGSVAMILCRTS